MISSCKFIWKFYYDHANLKPGIQIRFMLRKSLRQVTEMHWPKGSR
jgi:hypothetical protein